jgi:hypothetical protein
VGKAKEQEDEEYNVTRCFSAYSLHRIFENVISEKMRSGHATRVSVFRNACQDCGRKISSKHCSTD